MQRQSLLLGRGRPASCSNSADQSGGSNKDTKISKRLESATVGADARRSLQPCTTPTSTGRQKMTHVSVGATVYTSQITKGGCNIIRVPLKQVESQAKHPHASCTMQINTLPCVGGSGGSILKRHVSNGCPGLPGTSLYITNPCVASTSGPGTVHVGTGAARVRSDTVHGTSSRQKVPLSAGPVRVVSSIAPCNNPDVTNTSASNGAGVAHMSRTNSESEMARKLSLFKVSFFNCTLLKY